MTEQAESKIVPGLTNVVKTSYTTVNTRQFGPDAVTVAPPVKTVHQKGGTSPTVTSETAPVDQTGVTHREAKNIVGEDEKETNEGGEKEFSEGSSEGEETPEKGSKAERMARAIRIEKRAREREQRLAAKAKELEAKEKLAAERFAEVEKWKSLKENAKSISKADLLREFGLSYQDIIDEIVADGVKAADPEAARIEELEKKLQEKEAEEKRASEEKAAATMRQYALDYMQVGIDHVKANIDKFEMLSLKGPDVWDEAWELANAAYDTNKTIPDIISVLNSLEQFYTDEALAAAKSKKLQKQLGLTRSEADAVVAEEAKTSNGKQPTDLGAKRRPVSLGSRAAQSVPPAIKPGEKISDAERLRRVIEWGNARMGKR